MRPGDAAAAAAIEQAAFAEQWPSTAFEHELLENAVARYIVLTRPGPDGRGEEMIGFAGLWLMLDEAHVVSVAVRPGQRGRGYGRALLHALLDVARREGMSVATLECRVSNAPARSLYRRYGFHEVGLRKRYYADNHEDAVIMTTEEFDSPAYGARYEELGAELALRLPALVVAAAED